MKVRAFFALRVSERVARQLANFSDELCAYDRGLDATWVDSSSYHLTLCFLGEISMDRVEALQRATEQRINAQRFEVQLDHIGYHSVSPELSVVAAMTSEQDEVEDLHEQVVSVVDECGIDQADRDYLPHITLARLPAENQFEVDADFPELDLRVPCESVVLLQSRPGVKGSVYTPLFEVGLSETDS